MTPKAFLEKKATEWKQTTEQQLVEFLEKYGLKPVMVFEHAEATRHGGGNTKRRDKGFGYEESAFAKEDKGHAPN
jgi:hypothetical protein